MEWISKHKILFIALLLTALVTIWYNCVHQESLRDIKAYRGDGKIKYIPAPGPFGIDGSEIEMPHFDLSKSLDIEYNLSGLPRGGGYIIYLVVPAQAPLEKILLGSLSYTIKVNGKVIKEVSSQIKNLVNNRRLGGDRFYFETFNSKSQKWVHLLSDKQGTPTSLAVKCDNDFLRQPVEAYIALSRGGFK